MRARTLQILWHGKVRGRLRRAAERARRWVRVARRAGR
jgi:hypothetical protein